MVWLDLTVLEFGPYITINDVLHFLGTERNCEENIGFNTALNPSKKLYSLEVNPDVIHLLKGTFQIRGDILRTFTEEPLNQIAPITFDGGADVMQLYWKSTNSLWTSLPREIKERILCSFHSKEIVKTLTVSKDWNDMVNQSTTIWRNLCNREYPHIPN